MQLTDRQRAVLFQVIRGFLETGVPVSSSRVARSGVLSVSSATIRNVMSDLEGLGMLNQPHTSAGRAPTALALRMYVDALVAENALIDPFQAPIKQLASEVNLAPPEVLTRKAGSVLSDLTRLTSIISLHSMSTVRLQDIHLKPLDRDRLLVLLITDDEQFIHRIVSLGAPLDDVQVVQLQNYLGSLVVGLTLDQVRMRVLRERAQEREAYDALTRAALEIGTQLVEDIDSSAQARGHVEGVRNVLEYEEFTEDIDRLKELMAMLEQKERVLELIDRLCDAPGSVMTFIGPELNWDLGDDFSLVLCGYQRHGEQVGVLGVLGPMRLDYARIIPAVGSIASLLTARLDG